MTTICSEMLYKNKWRFQNHWLANERVEESSDFKNYNLITAHERYVINN